MPEPKPEPPEEKSDIHLSPDRALEEPEESEDIVPEKSESPEEEFELENDAQVEIKIEDTELEEGEILDDDVPVMLKYKYLEGKCSFPPV